MPVRRIVLLAAALRIRGANDAPERPRRSYVLYWMIAARRPAHNFALDRAVEHARRLDRPLLVFEALRCGHKWASERTHRFVIDGMAENAARCAQAEVAYYPYVEPAPGEDDLRCLDLRRSTGVVTRTPNARRDRARNRGTSTGSVFPE